MSVAHAPSAPTLGDFGEIDVKNPMDITIRNIFENLSVGISHDY